ncbi:hypothetical protein C8R42DRAFT_112419 [Lentinula raphanica]|nr:hypothetical protein C8R42DRAFT_112419 [Lentinula raphanica]
MTRLTRLTLRAVLMLGLLSSGVLAAPASTPQSTGAQALNRCSDSQTGGTPATANVRIKARGGCISSSSQEPGIISWISETDEGGFNRLVNHGMEIEIMEINKLMHKLDPETALYEDDLVSKLMRLRQPTARQLVNPLSKLINTLARVSSFYSEKAMVYSDAAPNPFTEVLETLRRYQAEIQQSR